MIKNADMPAQPLPNGADGRPFAYMNGEHHMPGHAFGFTKREELAARAMQGLLSNPGLIDQLPRQNDGTPQWFADTAYMYADALLAEPKKGQSS